MISISIGTPIGASTGRALARRLIAARFRRLAREASGHFSDGEKLVAPVAICSRGVFRRVFLFTVTGICALAYVVMFFIADRVFGRHAAPVMFEVIGAGSLLILLAAIVPHKYAAALTDRRLLVFRRDRVSGRHIKDIFIAASRSDVFTDFRKWFGSGILSLEFAPATGQAPIMLNFEGLDSQIAETIHLYLATATTEAHATTRSTKPPTGQ